MKNYRIIHKENVETKLPTMPFIIAYDGIVGEAISIRDLINILILEYEDAEDQMDDWNLRLEFARKECMKLLAVGIDAVVYDNRKGVIKNNYAAAEGDADYDEEYGEDYFKILIHDEKDFLRSLIKVESIKILEREDINCIDLKQHKCSECIFNKNNVCSIYDMDIKNAEEENNCSSCAKGNISEYTGGKYKEISAL